MRLASPESQHAIEVDHTVNDKMCYNVMFNLVYRSPLYLGTIGVDGYWICGADLGFFLDVCGKGRDSASAERSCERLIRTAHF